MSHLLFRHPGVPYTAESDFPVSYLLPSQTYQSPFHCPNQTPLCPIYCRVRLPCVHSFILPSQTPQCPFYCPVRLPCDPLYCQVRLPSVLLTAQSGSPVSYLLLSQTPQGSYLLKRKTTQCHIYCWVRLALNNLQCPKTSLLLPSLSFNPGWYNFSTKKTFS